VKKDWEYIKLSDACTIHGRIGWQGLTRAEHKRSGDYLLITGTDFTEDNKINLDTCVYVDEFRYTQDENIQIRKNDLLITKDGTLGKLALITEDLPKPATLNGGIFVIRDKINKLYPPFLLNYMKSDAFRKIIHNHRTGSTVPHLTQNMLVNFPIPVPPLEEQKRIVKILDEKFAQLETIKANAQTNLQNAKDLFQSQLTKAFSNTTWEKKRLGEVCDVRDGTHDSPKFYDKGYPLVTSKNLKNGKIEMINLKYISKEDYEKINERSKVDINDILFAMIGTIGNPVLVTEEPTYAIKNMALIKDIGSIFPNYLLFYLSSNCALDKMLHDSNGTTQRFVSLNYLRNFEIPLPPLPEQKRIVKELDTLSEKVRQLQEIYTKQIANCDELKQSYLQKAFEGEL